MSVGGVVRRVEPLRIEFREGDTQSLSYADGGQLLVPGSSNYMPSFGGFKVQLSLDRAMLADISFSCVNSRTSGRIQFNLYWWQSLDVIPPGYPTPLVTPYIDRAVQLTPSNALNTFERRDALLLGAGPHTLAMHHQAADNIGAYVLGPRSFIIALYPLV